MSTVKSIGEGYYGIVSEGVSVDAAVAKRISDAFREARTMSLIGLTIRDARPDDPVIAGGAIEDFGFTELPYQAPAPDDEVDP